MKVVENGIIGGWNGAQLISVKKKNNTIHQTIRLPGIIGGGKGGEIVPGIRKETHHVKGQRVVTEIQEKYRFNPTDNITSCGALAGSPCVSFSNGVAKAGDKSKPKSEPIL